jgi:plastocyanin
MADTSVNVQVIIGLAAGIALVALFATNFTTTTPIPDPRKVIDVIDVRIPEGASIDSGKNFQPQKALVVVGEGNEYCCSTVRWHNRDSAPAIIRADDDSDPEFYEATKDLFIKPGESFDFRFTKPGEFGYHGKPWQHGTVVVLQEFS